jgi:uncharacterized protein YbjT (DUF2867 family)
MDRLASQAFTGAMTTNANDTLTTLVLGGTGKTGRRVAERLTARGLPVRIGSRAAVPPFDWQDRDTWPDVLHGVASVYLTYQPDLAFTGAVERVRDFVDLAIASGTGRLVLLSGRNEDSALAAERAVQSSDVDWTIVRSSFFDQNFSEAFLLEAVLDGLLAFPADLTTEPFIDADDIADVVAAALTDAGHVGQLYEVTGPRLMTFADATAEIAAAVGRDVQYVPVSVDDFSMAMRAAGVPDDEVRDYAKLFSTVLDGRGSYLADGVQRALGREPRDFRDYARATAATGVWSAPHRGSVARNASADVAAGSRGAMRAASSARDRIRSFL